MYNTFASSIYMLSFFSGHMPYIFCLAQALHSVQSCSWALGWITMVWEMIAESEHCVLVSIVLRLASILHLLNIHFLLSALAACFLLFSHFVSKRLSCKRCVSQHLPKHSVRLCLLTITAATGGLLANPVRADVTAHITHYVYLPSLLLCFLIVFRNLMP